MSGDLIPTVLFLCGLVLSLAAECRLRRPGAAPFASGCITVVGAGLVFVACATAIL